MLLFCMEGEGRGFLGKVSLTKQGFGSREGKGHSSYKESFRDGQGKVTRPCVCVGFCWAKGGNAVIGLEL